MATADKLTYLNETKSKIRKAIEDENLVPIDDNTTFREYADKIKATNEEIKKYVPTDSQSGTSLQVTNAVPLNVKKGVIDGNSYQGTTLPSEYTQVDYIESDGASYIDTNYIPNANTDINTKVYISDYSLNRNYICGSYGPNIEGRYQVTFGQVAEDANFMWCRGTYIGRIFIPEDSNSFLIKTDKSKITIKDKIINLTDEFIGTSNNLFLFANNSDGNVGSLSSGVRIYYFKIYENNTVVRDFIPCYRNSDNAIGLYDLVNDIFYENQGTGAFTYGSVATIPNPDYPQEIEVVSGKNLFDKESAIVGYIKEDGTIHGDRTYNTSDFIPVIPNETYYKTLTTSPRTKLFDKNKQPLNTTTYQDLTIGGKEGSFKIPANAYYFRFSFPINTIDINNIQIEKGDIATEIIPFNTLRLTNSGKNKEFELYRETDDYLIDLKGNFLAKIGDVKDTLDLTSGVLSKNIGKIVLNGSENWGMAYGTGMFHASRLIFPKSQVKAYSDKFIYNSVQYGIYNQLKDGQFALQNYNNNNAVFLKNMKFGNVEDFVNWLSSNNVTIYYPLETPETIQLDPITIKMYEGTNNIELDTNLETNMSIDYYKDYRIEETIEEVSEE